MSKSLRLSEKWFHRGLWLVALVFASFLIGLGGTVVDDLPKVEKQLELSDFMDKPASDALRNTITASDKAVKEATGVMEQSRLKRNVARSDLEAASETFDNWLATRRATQRADQDTELIARTQALDALKN